MAAQEVRLVFNAGAAPVANELIAALAGLGYVALDATAGARELSSMHSSAWQGEAAAAVMGDGPPVVMVLCDVDLEGHELVDVASGDDGPLPAEEVAWRAALVELKVMRRLAVQFEHAMVRLGEAEVAGDGSNESLVADVAAAVVAALGDTDDCHDRLHRMRHPDAFVEEFDSLPLIAKGLSKEVREVPGGAFHLVRYIPSIYSHTHQRSGIIEGSDAERRSMTRATLEILERAGIYHTYWFVGDHLVLAEAITDDDIPPVEVIIKRVYIGTDKHRYYKLGELNTRFGDPMIDGPWNEYTHGIVCRFDYRNPNHHPETGAPLGDYAMCDDLADYLINTRQAKKTAKGAFRAVEAVLADAGIYFQDVCFMIDTSGTRIWGEISQDCGRYKKIDVELEGVGEMLDKDVWRAGGSSDLVLEKWKRMTAIVTDHVTKAYYPDGDTQ